MNKTEAYRCAYESKKKGKGIHVDAHRAAAKPKVAEILAAYHQEEWTGAIADVEPMRRTALRVMREVAETGENEKNRLKAAELIGRTAAAGLYQSGGALHQHLHIEGKTARDHLISKLANLYGTPQVPSNQEDTAVATVPLIGTAQPVGQVIEARAIDPDPVVSLEQPGAGVPGTPPIEDRSPVPQYTLFRSVDEVAGDGDGI